MMRKFILLMLFLASMPSTFLFAQEVKTIEETAKENAIVNSEPVIVMPVKTPEKSVLIEIKALQVILNDEHLRGLDWEAIVSNYQKASLGADHLSFGTLSEEDYIVLLDALNTVGMITTISSMKIKVRYDEETLIAINPRETLGEGQEDLQGERQKHHDTVQFYLTTKLKDNALLMDIRPETIVAADVKQPSSTTLQLQDGATVVMGGVFRQTMFESMRKIPLLGDLPLVGFAFRNQGHRPRKTELMIFLTPKMVVKE